MLNNIDHQRFSIKQSIKHLKNLHNTLISNTPSPSNNSTDLRNDKINHPHDDQLIVQHDHQKIYRHLQNIRSIIEKKASLKDSNIDQDCDDKSRPSSSFSNSALKKSKIMQQLCEICINLFNWIRNNNEIRAELIKQAMNHHDESSDDHLILIIQDLDVIMSHVVRQFLCRKERKSGKTDLRKKAQIYEKIEKDANGIILELFVFSLSVGCFDSKEELLIEQVSNNLEMKLQKFWKTNKMEESVLTLGGLFLCLLINKNASPHHMLWNEFMVSVQIVFPVIVSHQERDRLLKSLYSIQLSASHNISQVVDIYKWVTVSNLLSCYNAKYLPKDISNYLLNPDSLDSDELDCKYITSRFILRQLRAFHTLPQDTIQLLSYHIYNFELENDFLKFLDSIIHGNSKYEEKLRKTFSEEMVFMTCLLARFYLLRRRIKFSNKFYALIKKFDLVGPIFELVLEYLVEKKNSFKSSCAYSILCDLLHAIRVNDAEEKFDPIAEKMIVIAEDLIERRITSLDTDMEHLKEWADRCFGLLISQSMCSIYPFFLRKCMSSMICRLTNYGDSAFYNKSSLIEIAGHFHNSFYSANSFLKRKKDRVLNKCLLTLVRLSGYIFLKIKPKYNDELTKFYVTASNLYKEKAFGFALRFTFLDSFYFDEISQTFKVFAIEEHVLENQSGLMLYYQRNALLTDLIIIVEESSMSQDSILMERIVN